MGTEIDDQQFRWTDPSGVEWAVNIGWSRMEDGAIRPTSLTLDSGGRRAVTSTVLRQVEGVLRAKRTKRMAQLQRTLAIMATDVREARDAGDPDADRLERLRQRHESYSAAFLVGEDSPKGAKRGRPVDHEVWLERVLVMWQARREGRPMLRALMEAEGLRPEQEDTARTYARRARAWDREHLRLLAGDPNNPATTGRAVTAAKAAARRKP